MLEFTNCINALIVIRVKKIHTMVILFPINAGELHTLKLRFELVESGTKGMKESY